MVDSFDDFLFNYSLGELFGQFSKFDVAWRKRTDNTVIVWTADGYGSERWWHRIEDTQTRWVQHIYRWRKYSIRLENIWYEFGEIILFDSISRYRWDDIHEVILADGYSCDVYIYIGRCLYPMAMNSIFRSFCVVRVECTIVVSFSICRHCCWCLCFGSTSKLIAHVRQIGASINKIHT